MDAVKKNKYLSLFILFILLTVVHLTFILTMAPPQLGWWNYYGWQISEGKLLYKDIYCFMPPYYVWLMGALYKIFDINLLFYQILGMLTNYIYVCMVFIILCDFFKPLISLIACFTGAVLSYSYLMYFPFDYNQIIIFYVICSAFFFVKGIMYDKSLYIYISGFFIGLFIMTKQTGIIYAFLLIIIILIESKVWGCNKGVKLLCKSIIGATIAISPGVLYLLRTKTFTSFISQISNATYSKGSVFNMVDRFYHYGFSYTEVSIAFIILIYILKKCGKNDIFSYHIFSDNDLRKNIIYYSFFLIIIHKCCRTFVACTGRQINFEVYFVLNIFYWSIWLVYNSKELKDILKKYIPNIFFEHNLKNNDRYCILIFAVSVLITTYFVFNEAFFWRSSIYNIGVVFALKRIIVTISFWVIVFWLLNSFNLIVRRAKEEDNLSLFVAFIIAFIATGFLSSILEEIYIMPIFAVFSCLLLYNRTNIVIKGIYFILITFILVSTITQKQVEPYFWHGWRSIGLGNPKLHYVYSNINGLECFIFDSKTEAVYENIIDAINIYSNKNDNVYEFPHITLFNVLTKRNLGTFAVAHYFDVCPDYIAEDDGAQLFTNQPAMVIWDEIGSDNWDFHERYFRDGKPSGQRKIRDFYNDIVKKNYFKVYSYNDITVWSKSNDNKKNLQFAINIFKRSLKLEGYELAYNQIKDITIYAFSDILNSRCNYTVHECLLAIITKFYSFGGKLTGKDIQHIFGIEDIDKIETLRLFKE
jgi:hypothetical protein